MIHIIKQEGLIKTWLTPASFPSIIVKWPINYMYRIVTLKKTLTKELSNVRGCWKLIISGVMCFLSFAESQDLAASNSWWPLNSTEKFVQVSNNNCCKCIELLCCDDNKHKLSMLQEERMWAPGNLHIPFTWENQKLQLENQMVYAIPFGVPQKTWAVIWGDAM